MSVSTTNFAVEWAPFELAEHINEQQLLDAADQIEREFLQQQYGYIRRELLRGKNGKWVDLIYWSTEESAALAAQAANDSEACMNYFSLMSGVEASEAGIAHFSQFKTWGDE